MTDSLYQQMIELDEFINAIPEDLDPKEYVEEFNAIMERIESKVDSCAAYFDFIAGRLEELNLKKERTVKAIKSYESKKKRMQDYLIACIRLGDYEPLKGSNTKISIRDNPVSFKTDIPMKSMTMKEVDPSFVPYDLHRYLKEKTVFYLDTRNIKDTLKHGETLPNCRLERTQSIVIRDI